MLALAADRAEVLVDAEDDEDELRPDAGEDHTDKGDQHPPPQARRPPHDDGQPIEYLDDRRRDEAFPLEKVANIEHAALLSTPSGVTRTDRLVTKSFTLSKHCAGVRGEIM